MSVMQSDGQRASALCSSSPAHGLRRLQPGWSGCRASVASPWTPAHERSVGPSADQSHSRQHGRHSRGPAEVNILFTLQAEARGIKRNACMRLLTLLQVYWSGTASCLCGCFASATSVIGPARRYCSRFTNDPTHMNVSMGLLVGDFCGLPPLSAALSRSNACRSCCLHVWALCTAHYCFAE